MTDIKYNCEELCENSNPIDATQFIVITGGPCAGKTAVLEFVRKIFCQHVAILPEAAGILFSGGFWRLQSVSAQNAAQKAIYHVQTEMESLVLEEKRWVLGLCDRGTLDGLAYWQGHEKNFFNCLNTTKDKEYAKYTAIIHLKTPDASSGYNHKNPIRVETPQVALEIDHRIGEIWKDHPAYVSIESTEDFFTKVNIATQTIHKLTAGLLASHQ